MKKVKMILSAIAVVGVVSGALAFKTAKFHPANLFQKKISTGACVAANATNIVGTVQSVPSGFTGFYPTNACVTAQTGYVPTPQ